MGYILDQVWIVALSICFQMLVFAFAKHQSADSHMTTFSTSKYFWRVVFLGTVIMITRLVYHF